MDKFTRGDVLSPFIRWFDGLGFRPACPAVFRDQYGDAAIWIVCDDVPLSVRYPGLFDLFPPAATSGASAVDPGAGLAAVPLSGPGGYLLAALAILAAPALWRAAGRFGAWFSAERGGGPGCNGWV